MILVGYHYTYGNNLYHAKNRRTMISRDIVFDEAKEVQQSVTGCTIISTGYMNENFCSYNDGRSRTSPS